MFSFCNKSALLEPWLGGWAYAWLLVRLALLSGLLHVALAAAFAHFCPAHRVARQARAACATCPPLARTCLVARCVKPLALFVH
jgi:hypothetical protein